MADTAQREVLVLQEIDDWWLSQVVGWKGSVEQLEAHLVQSLGCALPASVGETAQFGAGLVLRVAPERFWILGDAPWSGRAALEAVDPVLGGTLRLDHGRTRLRLSGPGVFGVLSRCVALDWQSAALAPGRFAQTMLHRLPVLLLRSAHDTFDLLIPRSFSQSIREWIEDAARAS
jgi:heterotetrameric sarcosine oxidase gamma subunit